MTPTLVNRGDGRDTISENDSTLGNSDTLLYEATINPLDLVLSRQANDLRIVLHGTTERVTIQNWYANPTTAQVETIQGGQRPNAAQHASRSADSGDGQVHRTNRSHVGSGAIDQQSQEVQTVLAASWSS